MADDIKKPINGHTDRTTWNWVDNILVQPSSGTGSGASSESNIHYKISLSKLGELVVKLTEVVNNCTTSDPGYIADARQLTLLKGLYDELLAKEGVANGIATLGSDGLVPSSQLPSYVDDVLEYDTFDDFPEEGESAKIYLDLETNLTYRWSGTTYVEISPSLALGETSSTAYAGDKGKANAEAIAALQTEKADQDTTYTKGEVNILLEDHESSNMPHLFEDLQTGKTYRYGFRLSENGNPQTIYEEVV